MSLADFDTTFPADSLEFCPCPKAQNIFTVGTYKLDVSVSKSLSDSGGSPTSKPQQRRGQCLVFEVNPDDSTSGYTLRKTQEIDLPAVLDMKWCHRSPSENAVLAVADSQGNVTLHEWRNDQRQLNTIQSISCASSETLCLSLDWSNRLSPSNNLGSLIVSLSNGSLCLLGPADNTGLVINETWHAHDFEPWVSAWDYWNTNLVYSGGDDLKLKGWDIRQDFAVPTFVNKSFDAGITSIQSHPHVQHVVAVGSYDNSVRIFDMRMPLRQLTQVDVGGGAWRVKWHPSASRKSDLLVACMHDDFKVIKFNLTFGSEHTDSDGTATPWEITKRFDSHQSLAYGVDWSFQNGVTDELPHGETLIGSCSFYDHTLHLWKA